MGENAPLFAFSCQLLERLSRFRGFELVCVNLRFDAAFSRPRGARAAHPPHHRAADHGTGDDPDRTNAGTAVESAAAVEPVTTTVEPVTTTVEPVTTAEAVTTTVESAAATMAAVRAYE